MAGTSQLVLRPEMGLFGTDVGKLSRRTEPLFGTGAANPDCL